MGYFESFKFISLFNVSDSYSSCLNSVVEFDMLDFLKDATVRECECLAPFISPTISQSEDTCEFCACMQMPVCMYWFFMKQEIS